MPTKILTRSVADGEQWRVARGKLVRGPGHPGQQQLFQVVAERIPFEALGAIAKDMKKQQLPCGGVYMLHDSMGGPRYAGLSINVFSRLRNHHHKYGAQLPYFSFFTVLSGRHQKEIETVMVRAVGNAAINQYKKAVGFEPGSLEGFAPGTIFYQRKKKSAAKKRSIRKGATKKGAPRRAQPRP